MNSKMALLSPADHAAAPRYLSLVGGCAERGASCAISAELVRCTRLAADCSYPSGRAGLPAQLQKSSAIAEAASVPQRSLAAAGWRGLPALFDCRLLLEPEFKK